MPILTADPPSGNRYATREYWRLPKSDHQDGAHAITAWSAARYVKFITGLLGTGVLLWPMYNSLYPVPNWPNNLWPYVVLIWGLAGIVAARLYRG